jgi:hypothetical protein
MKERGGKGREGEERGEESVGVGEERWEEREGGS